MKGNAHTCSKINQDLKSYRKQTTICNCGLLLDYVTIENSGSNDKNIHVVLF